MRRPWPLGGYHAKRKKLCTLAFWEFNHSYKKDQNLRWHVGLHTFVIINPQDGTSVPKHVIVMQWCVTWCICWMIYCIYIFRFLKNYTQYAIKILAFHAFGPPLICKDLVTEGPNKFCSSDIKQVLCMFWFV